VLPDEKISSLVGELFDLRPAALIQTLNLKKPIYQATAVYGHFGRVPQGDFFTWEQIDRVEELRRAAGR
jgi:S-adenosylmethionine synthetase